MVALQSRWRQMKDAGKSFRSEFGSWLIPAIGGAFISIGINCLIKREFDLGLTSCVLGIALGGVGIWWKLNPHNLLASISIPATKAGADVRVWIATIIVFGFLFYQLNKAPPSNQVAIFSAAGDQTIIGNDLPGMKLDRPVAKSGGKQIFNNNNTREYTEFPAANGEYSSLGDAQLKEKIAELEKEIENYSSDKRQDGGQQFEYYKMHFAQRTRSISAEVYNRTGDDPWNDPKAPEGYIGGKRIVLSGRATGFLPMKHVIYFLNTLETNFQKFVKVTR
jgi:hypothetical protein